MAYSIKEIFATLQGEGAHTGRAAVFCRFAGCNLWSGLETARADASCQFCDTDFIGTDGLNGGRYPDAASVAEKIAQVWTAGCHATEFRYVVLTGGEPLLQLDVALIDEIHARGFDVAIETNGTLPAPPGIDWICVSPKPGPATVQREGNELKLVYPQPDLSPEIFEPWTFKHFFLQPMDGPSYEANLKAALAYCQKHPRWRLSLQTHKLIGIP